jgi:hypothetical protein
VLERDMKIADTTRSIMRRARLVISPNHYHTIMRRYALISMMAIGLMVFAVPAIARTSHKHRPTGGRCTMQRVERHLVADAQVVLYVRAEGGGGPEGFEPAETVGCAYGWGHVFTLGPPNVASECLGPGGCESLEHPVVAGPFAAFDYGQSQEARPPFAEDLIRVVDLQTGQRVHNIPTGPSTPEKRVGIGPATAIVLKSDGSVAWIAERAYRLPPTAPPEYEVRAVDENGERLLASGTSVGPKSLALAGSTLYWTEAGRPMSAPLN